MSRGVPPRYILVMTRTAAPSRAGMLLAALTGFVSTAEAVRPLPSLRRRRRRRSPSRRSRRSPRSHSAAPAGRSSRMRRCPTRRRRMTPIAEKTERVLGGRSAGRPGLRMGRATPKASLARPDPGGRAGSADRQRRTPPRRTATAAIPESRCSFSTVVGGYWLWGSWGWRTGRRARPSTPSTRSPRRRELGREGRGASPPTDPPACGERRRLPDVRRTGSTRDLLGDLDAEWGPWRRGHAGLHRGARGGGRPPLLWERARRARVRQCAPARRGMGDGRDRRTRGRRTGHGRRRPRGRRRATGRRDERRLRHRRRRPRLVSVPGDIDRVRRRPRVRGGGARRGDPRPAVGDGTGCPCRGIRSREGTVMSGDGTQFEYPDQAGYPDGMGTLHEGTEDGSRRRGRGHRGASSTIRDGGRGRRRRERLTSAGAEAHRPARMSACSARPEPRAGVDAGRRGAGRRDGRLDELDDARRRRAARAPSRRTARRRGRRARRPRRARRSAASSRLARCDDAPISDGSSCSESRAHPGPRGRR